MTNFKTAFNSFLYGLSSDMFGFQDIYFYTPRSRLHCKCVAYVIEVRRQKKLRCMHLGPIM